MVSTHGDIYSYGILVLEMITGRRPTDNTCEQGFSLRKCVEMALNNRAMDILDVELVTELENAPPATSMDGPSERVNSLISLLKLGLLCSGEMPLSRMSTKDIIKELLVIKRALA
jgi:receptor kinase-like protein